MGSRITVEEANQVIAESFHDKTRTSRIVEVGDGHATAVQPVDERHLRPGGYNSGPTQMALVDLASYLAVMTKIGVVPMTVTSNLNINFLRPCIGTPIVAKANVVKLGRTLALIEVDVRTEGAEKPASLATVTYSIPAEVWE